MIKSNMKPDAGGGDVQISQLDAFEPNTSFFESLQEDVFQVDRTATYRQVFIDNENLRFRTIQNLMWGPDPSKFVQLRCEPFTSSTMLDTRYDLITLMHVFYYFVDETERLEIMEKLLNHLEDDGRLCIVHSIHQYDGKTETSDHLMNLFRKITSADGVGGENLDYQVTSNLHMSAEDLFRELQAMKTANMDLIIEPYQARFQNCDPAVVQLLAMSP